MFQVKTLGELKQTTDAGTPAKSLRRKPLALVAYLARRAPRAVSRTELATLFWGESGEERARQSLRQALLEVKQALGESVDVDSETVRLTPGSVELDAARFEQEIAGGRIEEAVARWTGDFFEAAEDIGGDGFRRWIENERAGLHQQLGLAMERLIGDAELKGEWTRAAEWAERWAQALPFDEQAHLRLIEALRMSNRSGDALKTHAGFVSRLRGALDLEPSAEFLRLGGNLADDARAELARRGRSSVAVHPPALSGRGAVVGELVAAWEDAVRGAPVVCLIRGEAGSGRTRTCDEAVELVGEGGVVLRTRGDGGADFATLAALLESLPTAPGLAGAAPEALAEVAPVVPALAARFKNLSSPSGTEAALRDAVTAVLSAVSEEKPVLLVVDDVQLADPASARLLSALGARLPARVMLLLVENETHERAGLALEARGLRRVTLGRLTLAEVESMLGSMVTMEQQERHALAARLFAESAGVPLGVQSLVEALVDERLLALDPAGGSWRLSPALATRPLPVPWRIRERIQQRLESLPQSFRAVLEALAVLGEPAVATVIGAVAKVSPDDAEEALTALASRRALLEDGASPPRYTFNIPLGGRAILALIPPSRRQVLHERAARVLTERDLASTAERSLLSYHVARAEPVAEPVIRRRAQRSWRTGALVAGGLGAVALALYALKTRGPGETADAAVPIVALGQITDYRANAGPNLTHPLTDMLATNLGRVRRLRVVSSARMHELVGQGGQDTSAAGLVAAARRAGATELVDGALYARDDGGLRLDLRRVELTTGSIKQTYSVTGRTVFDLADSSTARLAADFGEATPAGSIADVTTRSLAAYALYEQGLRAFYNNDLRGAQPLFDQALREDSTFAMAAYYSALSEQESRGVVLARFEQAKRLASRITDRERLTILARYAFLSSSNAILPYGDTLVIRYPDEVQGYLYIGIGQMQNGEYLKALEPFNRVVTMDSLALAGRSARCEACDALRQIVVSYALADSLPAAVRTARRWIRLQPHSAVPWLNLADMLAYWGKGDESLAAFDSAARIGAGFAEGRRLTIRAVYLLFAGRNDEAERLLTSEIGSGVPFREFEARWFRSIGYRQQGRLLEALADTRRYRTLGMAYYPRGIAEARKAAPQEALGEAQMLFELGRYRPAAALFDSISRWMVPGESESQRDHNRAWAMTHAGRALAAAGDTTGLSARADTIQALGARTGSGRDQLLFHYVRGLVLQARGQDQEACAEFRASIISWPSGYTRENMALAECLLRLQRPLEAVAAIQPALRGNIEASNYYASRTELHELLGRAWDAVGTPAARDSARAHYREVERSWSRADPSFNERLGKIRNRLAALGSG